MWNLSVFSLLWNLCSSSVKLNKIMVENEWDGCLPWRLRLILGKTYCPCSYVGLACPREITLLFFCFDQRTVEEEFCAPEVVFSHRGRGVEAVERPWRCSKGRKLWEAETEVVMRFKRINEGELKKKNNRSHTSKGRNHWIGGWFRKV